MTATDEPNGVLSRLDPHLRATGRWLTSTAPWLERPLTTIRGCYAHAYVRHRQWEHNRSHEAPIDPYRIAWVDPDRIRRVVSPDGLPRFRRAGDVRGGDWDRTDQRFADLDVYQAFELRFEEGAAWAETAFFQRVLREIREGEEPWGCSSRAELEARCEKLESLYETIDEEGFRTQRELLEEEVDDPIPSRRRSTFARLINDEIAIDVGRDGELLFYDGRNRLSIAKVLDVDAVPVLILRRHPQWVAFRDRVARHVEETGGLPGVASDHPDLRQLAPE